MKKLLYTTFLICYLLNNFSQNIDSLNYHWNNKTLNDSLRLTAYYNYLFDHPFLNSIDSNIIYINKAIDYCNREKQYYSVIKFLSLKATIFNTNGKNQEAEEALTKASTIGRKHKQFILTSKIENNLALLKMKQGKYSEAIKILFDGLNFLKINNQNGGSIINKYNNIGNCYLELEKYALAIKYFKESVNESIISLHEEKNLAQAYNNIGNAYTSLQVFDTALVFINKSLEIRKKINDVYGVASCINNKGYVYLDNNDLKNALLNFKESNKLFNEIENKRWQLITLMNILDVQFKLKQFNNIISEEKNVFNLANEVGQIEDNKNAYDLYFKSYKATGKYDKALEFHIKFEKLKDSIFSEKNIESITEQNIKHKFVLKQSVDSIKTATEKQYTAQLNETKLSKEQNQKLLFASIALLALLSVGFVFYQYKLKQKTNAQLNDINDKINKQNNTLKTLNKVLIDSEENLQKSNSTKEQLISMMSHDLLNPITAITNYNQQIISSKTKNEELLSAFKNVDAAIQPMHSLLDNMLQWSAIQKDGVTAKLKTQDITEIVKEIISIYRPQATLKFIKLTDAFDKDFVLNTDKSILSLILRNLLNNAIKYSGNDTQILIATNTVTKTITITDQGFGMTDEMINYLNTKQLNKIQSKGTGLGLKLCLEFAEAINAHINFTKNATNGVSVIIKLNAA